MKSHIAELLKLSSSPIAVVQSDTAPEDALSFKPETKRACMIGMLLQASHGKNCAFTAETTPCVGARAGFSFAPYPLDFIRYFLSTGNEQLPGEYYKQSPKLVDYFVATFPAIIPQKYLLLQPLEKVREGEVPGAVIFLVNADQLSALVTLANYDYAGNDQVKVDFGAGCAQTVLYPMVEEQNGGTHCYIGLTDLSARKVMPKDIMAFSLPYTRFLALEKLADESFLGRGSDWATVSKRI